MAPTDGFDALGTTFGYQVARELRHTRLTPGPLGLAATLLSWQLILGLTFPTSSVGLWS
jgi:hypothetical protein